MEKKRYLLFLIIPVSQILMLGGKYIFTSQVGILGVVGIILSVIADMFLFYTLLHGAKKEIMEKEVEELRYLKEIESRRNFLLNEKQTQLDFLKEELENLKEKINRSLGEGDRQGAGQYMEELQKQIDSARYENYCQNRIVNAIISEKQKRCSALGFCLETELLISDKISIEPLHLCSVFSNLLDNAIEAVEELEQTRRKIRVDAKMEGKYLFIKVQNSSSEDHAYRKIREDHGIGTFILDNISKKYEGSYLHDFDQGNYTATVVLKVM